MQFADLIVIYFCKLSDKTVFSGSPMLLLISNYYLAHQVDEYLATFCLHNVLFQ